MLDGFIEQMLQQRALFFLQERNRAALERLHDARHEADHDDLENRLKQVLSDSELRRARSGPDGVRRSAP